MTAYSALRVNAERLLADFHELCEIGATIHGGISRLALSNEDLRARAWLDRRFQDAVCHFAYSAVFQTSPLRIASDCQGNPVRTKGPR